jgi:NAD(P)-dependent dehydrogenase (short-subunit alcohol dehydrogenase family)
VAHALASLVFYARFLRSFSRLGVRRCQLGEAAGGQAFADQQWLVTGATGGIGQAIALGAARRGARVWALGRNAGSLDALRAAAPAGSIQPLRCDLASVASTLGALAKVDAPLQVLVNNVGVMQHAFQRTPEGVESSFATNLLVPFAMTERLLECGRLGPGALILNMSSGGMYGARLDVRRLETREPAAHDGFMSYAQHKRAQAALAEYWNRCPDGPVAHVMHPGWVDTQGVRSALPAFRRTLGRLLRSAEEGADIALWLAAQRPPAAPVVWHDRAAHDLHAFAFTRGGDTSERLVAALRRRLRAIAEHALASAA